MLDLIGRLLSLPYARDRRVALDECGRLTSASMTLSLHVPSASALPDRPAATVEEDAALADASRWLDAATLAHIRSFALGEERSFHVDSEKENLRLRFDDGATLDLEAQILGSYAPQDGSFRWSWANSGVRSTMAQAGSAARDHADARRFAALQAPTFHASFDESRRLAALAARLGGCDGVYRCATAEHVSFFVGYKTPELDRAAWFHGPDAEPAGEAAAM
jgi:hypothetical protein